MRVGGGRAKDAEIPAERGSTTRGSNRRSPSWEATMGAEVPASGPS